MTAPTIRYTFGDDDPAAERLRLVAEAYRATSTAFLRAHAPSDVELAVDLGCGPGYSTELLGDACRPRRLLGLDASATFLERAAARVPAAAFVVHDASRTPLPCPPSDVLFARLLLAHLPDPATVVHHWQEALAPGGVLLVQDLEDVEAPPGALRDYDDLSAEIVRSGGGTMYGGRALAALGGECVDVPVPARTAATIYGFNVERWLTERPPPAPRERLVALQRGLGSAGAGPGAVVWLVRQVALPAR